MNYAAADDAKPASVVFQCCAAIHIDTVYYMRLVKKVNRTPLRGARTRLYHWLQSIWRLFELIFAISISK